MDLKKKWKDIKGYEGKYIISNYGEIISLPRYKQNNSKPQYVEPKEIAKYINSKNGYVYVQLWNNSKCKNIRLHKLVAQNFIPNKENKLQINHIDGNKQNNRVDNLEWCTYYYNNSYGTKLERQSKSQINDFKKSKKVNKYDLDGNFIKTWISMKEVERQLGIFSQHIYRCCKGKRKSTGGFIWKYK